MMLTIITGRAKSGKSQQILEQIVDCAQKGQKDLLLLTPEQFSHGMERRLAAVGGPSICCYAEVLSFTRLATRVFSAQGGIARQSLDQGGRVLTMARALESVRSRLRLYGAASSKPSFYTTLLSAVDELKSYAVSSAMLRQGAQEVGGELAVKLEDLGLILDAYDALCANGRADPRDVLVRLADKLEQSCWAKSCTVFIDGFTDFTALELQVVAALLKDCKSMTIALACEPAQNWDLLSDTALQTAMLLERMAHGLGQAVEWKALPDGQGMPEALRHLNHALFSADAQPYPKADACISLVQSASALRECQAAVERLQQLVRSGVRYSELAIAVSDSERYGAILQGLCNQYAIPIYISGNKDILQKPVLVYLTAALDAATGGMEVEDVFRCLKTGLSALDQETVDALENYALVWNIRGSRWAQPFTAHPQGYAGQWDAPAQLRLEQLNEGRLLGIAPLLCLQQALRAAKNTEQMVRALYAFIESTGLEEKLTTLAESLYATHRQEAMEHLQLYATVVEAMEQCVAVLGDAVMEPSDFKRLFSIQLSQYAVGTIPVMLDAVLCGTIMNLRNHAPRYLFVLGASENAFPAATAAVGVLSEDEREQLELYGIQLAPNSEGKLRMKLAGILSVLSSPQEGLWVSYNEGDGASSYLFQRLCALFPNCCQQEDGSHLALYSPTSVAAMLVGLETAQRDCAEHLYEAFPQLASLSTQFRRMAGHDPGALSAQTVHALWGNTLSLTASRLSSYAKCHQLFFLQYGLQASVYEKARFNAPVFGTFVHYVLEHTVEQVQAEGGFASLSEERVQAIAEAWIGRYTAEEMHDLAGQPERFVYLYRRNLQEVRRVIGSMAEELRMSEFQPAAFELQFAPHAQVQPYLVQANGVQGQVSGFVDRLDLYNQAGVQYFRIVDYKTGNKELRYADIYHGLDLQLLIYLFALERDTKAFGELHPAGVLYVPAQSTVLRSNTRKSLEELEKDRNGQLRRTGILRNDPAILEAMEHCNGEPKFLPYTKKKNRLVGDLMDLDQLGLLRRHVDRRLSQFLLDMAGGQVAPNPFFKAGGVSACSWCVYHTVCHPDAGCRRYIAAKTSEKFWSALREWEEKDG